jgi:putative proteasome-type protease
MTYCLGIAVQEGLVFVSDSRTNAGVDNVSAYSKMYSYGVPGERQFFICASGNLATTQGVITQIERDMRKPSATSLLSVSSVADAAAYIGAISRAEQEKNTGGGPIFEANFLVGGEVAGARCRLFMIYPQGNYIQSSRQTPFLQIGESKYGKPILDRIVNMAMPLNQAALCALVSMEATLRSNLTVGPPIELNAYAAGSLQPASYRSFGDEDTYMRDLKLSWDALLQEAFERLPQINWNG